VTDREPLDPQQLAAYFALTEVVGLLQYAVEQQLRTDGGISLVQFQILMGLTFAPGGRHRMTDIADRLVHSRSGLTYQVGALEKAGYVERGPDPADERGTIVSITGAGRVLIHAILPGHEQVVRTMLLDRLTPADTTTLTRILEGVRDGLRTHPPRSARPRSDRRNIGR
jgi:DNA-binding MarR family transcriptional regulator